MPNTSISFPASPTAGQTYTYGSTTYTFDGSFWSVNGSSVDQVSTNDIQNGAVTPAKLSTGGPSWTSGGNLTITGDLTVDTNTLFVDASANRVGVKTTSPIANYGLTVLDNIYVGNGSDLSPSGTGLGHISINGDGYTGYLTLDSTDMHIGHNASSRGLTLDVNEIPRLAITTTGLVGIGTTSPTAHVHVKGSNPSLRIENTTSSSGSGSTLIFGHDQAGSNYPIAALSSYLTDGSSTNRTGYLQFWTSVNNSLTEKMTIDQYGSIRQTMPYATSDWTLRSFNSGNTATKYGILSDFGTVGANNSSAYYFAAYDRTVPLYRFRVRGDGGIDNFTANNSNLSDERVKNSIAPVGSMWDTIKAIEIVNFKYNDQTHDDFNVGVIAQQVEQVNPVWVDESKWSDETDEMRKSVYTTDMTFAAIKALQEAMNRIEVLESRIAALETINLA